MQINFRNFIFIGTSQQMSKPLDVYVRNTAFFEQTCFRGDFKSKDTREFLHLQHKYSKSLSLAENLNFPPKTVNNLFKFHAQDSDLEYFF